MSGPAATPATPARPGTLTVASRITFAVAAVVVIGVAPQVWSDPMARKPLATIAFLVNAALNVLIGAAVLTPVARRGGIWRRVLLWPLAVLGAFLGLTLLDAAEALLAHPGMRLVMVAVFLCAVGDLVTAVLCIIAAVRRTRSVAA